MHCPFYRTITPTNVACKKILEAGIELSWLPPTEPNGEVHYVIYYTPEGGTEQSIDTGSDLTHYKLTGLERNRVYTNIAVQTVNSAGRSNRSTIISPPSEMCIGDITQIIGMHTLSRYVLHILCIYVYEVQPCMRCTE